VGEIDPEMLYVRALAAKFTELIGAPLIVTAALCGENV
jgi:hypothetical protein